MRQATPCWRRCSSGAWTLHEARADLAPFYPSSGADPVVGSIWARTLPCQNPACGVDIPLMCQFWLAKKRLHRGFCTTVS